MKLYKIKNTIMLSFLTSNEQADYLLDEWLIGFDGKDIYLVKGDLTFVTITSNNAINIYLENGSIEEYHA